MVLMYDLYVKVSIQDIEEDTKTYALSLDTNIPDRQVVEKILRETLELLESYDGNEFDEFEYDD